MKPALLIVHGAYFLPAAWQEFMDMATAAGFEVKCPRQPTTGDSRPPKMILADDVAVIQKAATELKAAGHPIVVLAHSFGGIVATESLVKDLYAAEPRNATTPGVVRLVYLCGHLTTPGNSVGDIFAKHGFLCDVDLQMNEDGTSQLRNAPESFFDDLSSSAAALHSDRLTTHNFGLLADTKVSRAPWLDISTTYVYCRKDRAVKLPLQEAMVNDVREAGGRIETMELDAAHNPFLSAPKQLLEGIQKLWNEVERTL